MVHGICLEGGGAAGLAHVGALEVLEERGELKDLQMVVGSSAGAILAAALACKATTAQMKEIMQETDFAEFADDSTGFLWDTWRLVSNYGWHKGKDMRLWIVRTLEELCGNGNITFDELHEQTGIMLEVTFTRIAPEKTETIYASYENYPNMCVAEAVYRSALIPIYFQTREDPYEDNVYYCDGGLLDNYPLWRLYRLHTKKYVGLKLVSRLPREKEGTEEGDSVISYVTRIVKALRDQALNVHVDSDDWEHTIAINTGTIKATDFALSEEDKKHLLSRGSAAAVRYFTKSEGKSWFGR